MSKVEITSSCLVGAANASPISRLELTPFDLRFLLLNSSQIAIIFHKPENKIITHRLKASLSRTLDFFSPLAGRLASVKNDVSNTASFFLDCNNAGVEFVEAVARDLTVSDILDPKCIPEELVSHLFPLNGMVNIEGTLKPLLGVQVTELKDGLIIASTANHAVVDGFTRWRFFNSWSEISRGSHTVSKLPVFERWFPPNCNVDRLIPIPLTLPPILEEKKKPLRRRVFKFSKETLSKLKAKANSEAGTNKISTLQALSAHLWRSYTRCRRRSNGEASKFMMAIGARGRLPLPQEYFGTAVYVDKTAVNEEELLQNGVGYAALKINEFVAQQTKERAIKFTQDWMENPILPVNGNFSFTISGSPMFNVYEDDFGWGKPIGLTSGIGICFDGNMTTFSTAEGGIEVHACSTRETLQAMEDDGAELLN